MQDETRGVGTAESDGAAQVAVLARYQAALAALAARLEEDFYVLAVIVYGSLARGDVWQKSDIDLVIVLRDGNESRARPYIWLVEDGINVFAEVYQRSRFRRLLEGSLQGSVIHSIRSQYKLLFSKDESIAAWFRESAHIGARDREFQLLRAAADVPYLLDKAQKWFYAKHDLNYSFLWLMFAVNALARVEVVLSGEAPGREALDQALRTNPAFFETVYTNLVNAEKTEACIAEALAQVDGYLLAHATELFGPVLDYLAAADDPPTSTELNAYFRKKVQGATLGGVYEWLAEHGVIEKLSAPIRLTRKSLVELEEPAYYYDTDDLSEWE